MTPDERIRMLLVFAVTLCLAVWVGGGIVSLLLIVPAVFESLPREQAGDLGQTIFFRWNFVECLLGAAALLMAFALGRVGWRTRRRHMLATSFLLGMTLVALVFLLVLTPALSTKWEGLKEAGVDLDDPNDMPAERAELRTVHGIYMLLDVVKVVAGLGVFWLLAGRRRS